MSQHYDYEKLEEIITQIKEKGLSYVDGAREFDIPVRWLYEHNRQKNRAAKEGKETANKEKSPPVNSSPFDRSPLPAEVQQLIIDYRKEHPDHGFKRIEDHLKGCYVAPPKPAKLYTPCHERSGGTNRTVPF